MNKKHIVVFQISYCVEAKSRVEAIDFAKEILRGQISNRSLSIHDFSGKARPASQKEEIEDLGQLKSYLPASKRRYFRNGIPSRKYRLLDLIPYPPAAICAKDLTKRINENEGTSVGQNIIGGLIAELIASGDAIKRPPTRQERKIGKFNGNIRMVYSRANSTESAPSAGARGEFSESVSEA